MCCFTLVLRERHPRVHREKEPLVNEISLSENVSRQDSKNKIQIHKKRRKVVFDDANEDDDDDVHILTSAAFKASSCFESFFVFLFFLFFFFIITVLRSSSSSSSSRGCWCFSLVVSLLFRRVFTIACISVLRKSRTLLKREKKRVSQKFSLLSFFLSLETRARMRVRSGG